MEPAVEEPMDWEDEEEEEVILILSSRTQAILKEGVLILSKLAWECRITSMEWDVLKRLQSQVDQANEHSWSGSWSPPWQFWKQRRIEAGRGYVSLAMARKGPKLYLTRAEWKALMIHSETIDQYFIGLHASSKLS